MSDARPDTEDTPPHPRRHARNEMDLARAAPTLDGEGGRWSVGDKGIWAGLALTVLGAFAAGAMWVGAVEKDVTELQAWRKQYLAEQAKHSDDTETRVRTLELAQVKSADNIDAITGQLSDIKTTLGRIETAVGAQPVSRHPRNRPIGAQLRAGP